MDSPNAKPTYWNYLGLEKLLSLQSGLEEDGSEPAPDELHFIIVHQVFELWFKLVLRELRLARDHLSAEHVPEQTIPHVVHHLRRVATILEHTTTQWAVMETLTPQDFLDFRDKLVPASGFQSFQMREIEIVLGLDPALRESSDFGDPIKVILDLAKESPSGNLARARIEAALEETSLRHTLHDWLFRTPITGSAPTDANDRQVVEAFIADYLKAMTTHHAEQVKIYNEHGTVAEATAERRFAAVLDGARSFLAADDVADENRWHAMRARGALLFIESYRELPLLSWPHACSSTPSST